MSTITKLILPPIALNQEQSDAITAAVAVAAANAALPAGATRLTPATYLEGIVSAQIATLVQSAYQASVASLGTAAAGLSYSQRQALIATIKAALPSS